jgi:membrane protein
MPVRVIASVDAWQRRHALAGFPVAVLRKFGEDRAASLAALVAYYAFFSLFPLLLALVSVLGFVLEGNPSLQREIVDTALGRIPVIGAQLGGEIEPLTGSGIALAVGLAGALWAGLGVTVAFGRAFAEIWDVPRLEQPSGLRSRVRGLGVLVILATTLVAATVGTGVAVGGAVSAPVERVAAVVASVGVNVLVFLTIFALLTPGPRHIRALLPGVAVAAFGWLVLQTVGAWYVDHVIAGASATYGVFALVIGLLSWFWLAAQLVLVAAEVNVVLFWRLWPRSMAGDLEPADERAMRRFAEARRLDRREEISVEFSGGPSPEDAESRTVDDARSQR